MRRFLTRIGMALLVVWLVHLITFILIRIVPGDPAVIIAGEHATPEDIERVRETLGMADALPVQYVESLGSLVRGDLGQSIYSGVPVTELIAHAAPATISVTVLALLIASVLGGLAGTLAGLFRGTWIDQLVSLGATIGIGMPGFWVGMVLVTVFALNNPWLPATAYAPISEGVGVWASHIVLPALALAVAVAAELARHVRGAVSDVMEKPYVRTARSHGARGIWLVRRHVARNASIPVVTVLGLQAGKLLGGAIVIEAVFGIAGLGGMAVQSVLQRDYPVLQAYVIVAAVVVTAINLTVDGLYTWLNPKVRAA